MDQMYEKSMKNLTRSTDPVTWQTAHKVYIHQRAVQNKKENSYNFDDNYATHLYHNTTTTKYQELFSFLYSHCVK